MPLFSHLLLLLLLTGIFFLFAFDLALLSSFFVAKSLTTTFLFACRGAIVVYTLLLVISGAQVIT